MSAPVPATQEAFQLAEGPFWDVARRRLVWVDIVAGSVLEGTLRDGQVEVTRRHGFEGTVGAVTVAGDGSILVAAQEHLVVLDPDGNRHDGVRIVPAGQCRRLNDGSTDPAGRFLVGTLSMGDPSEREILVRLESDGHLTELDNDLTLSNGLAWSTDGSKMFSVDTDRQTIYVRDYDAATGEVGERRPHLRLREGSPDGIAMDVEDHLWVAVWGEGEIRRFAHDGALVDRITVPAPHTSCVAFAGEDLQTLVIATASAELSADDLQTYPDSGRLFSVRVDVPGLPVPPWSGSSRPSLSTR
jgi:sugar lactone lactonase YvrE